MIHAKNSISAFYILEYKELVRKNYIMLRRMKGEYKQGFQQRELLKTNANVKEVIRTKDYIKTVRVRVRAKRDIFHTLLTLSECFVFFARHSIEIIETIATTNKALYFYIRKLILCLVKKASYLINKCRIYNNKRMQKIKKSKNISLKHGVIVNLFNDRLNSINVEVASILALYGSIDDIKISNRKDYVRAIFHELNII